MAVTKMKECHNCPDRTSKCHATCERHKKEKEEYEQYRKQLRELRRSCRASSDAIDWGHNALKGRSTKTRKNFSKTS